MPYETLELGRVVGPEEKEFFLTHSKEEINTEVARLAVEISNDYRDLDPVLLTVLNGAKRFTDDLAELLTIPFERDSIQVKASKGLTTSTAHTVKDFEIDVSGRHVIIGEDLVDAGYTIDHITGLLESRKPLSISVAVLCYKRGAHNGKAPDYIGIDNMDPADWIVGYGIDYKEWGRDLNGLYAYRTDTI